VATWSRPAALLPNFHDADCLRGERGRTRQANAIAAWYHRVRAGEADVAVDGVERQVERGQQRPHDRFFADFHDASRPPLTGLVSG